MNQREQAAAEHRLRLGRAQIEREATMATCAGCGAQMRKKHGVWHGRCTCEETTK